jgi:hypothetical protein
MNMWHKQVVVTGEERCVCHVKERFCKLEPNATRSLQDAWAMPHVVDRQWLKPPSKPLAA